MAQVRRVAITAFLFVIVSVTAALPHRHAPVQDGAGDASRAGCLVHSGPAWEFPYGEKI